MNQIYIKSDKYEIGYNIFNVNNFNETIHPVNDTNKNNIYINGEFIKPVAKIKKSAATLVFKHKILKVWGFVKEENNKLYLIWRHEDELTKSVLNVFSNSNSELGCIDISDKGIEVLSTKISDNNVIIYRIKSDKAIEYKKLTGKDAEAISASSCDIDLQGFIKLFNISEVTKENNEIEHTISNNSNKIEFNEQQNNLEEKQEDLKEQLKILQEDIKKKEIELANKNKEIEELNRQLNNKEQAISNETNIESIINNLLEKYYVTRQERENFNKEIEENRQNTIRALKLLEQATSESIKTISGNIIDVENMVSIENNDEGDSIEQSHNVYDIVLKVLRAYDTIEVPINYYKKLKVALKKNLNMNRDFTQYTALSTIKLESHSDYNIFAVVEYDESLEYTRIIILKPYSKQLFDHTKIAMYEVKYNEWKKQNSYINLK